MDPLSYLCDTVGSFTRAQARDVGYDDKAIAYAVRAQMWHRIRRGCYTEAHRWWPLDEVGRHRIRTRAVLVSLDSPVAVSHVSAAVEHGIASWGVSLDRVHVTRLDGAAGRIEGDVVHHVGRYRSADLVERGGMLMTSPTRSALETAITASAEAGLVHLDSLLNLELADQDDLCASFELMHRWPGTQHLHIPVRMADGGAQSPGESRGRWLFRQGGLPAPKTQFDVHDTRGSLLGTSDWAWPAHGLLGEFDGRLKYGRSLRPDQSEESVGDVIFAEKQREDTLREATQFRMVRLIWADLQRPNLTAARVRRLMRQAS